VTIARRIARLLVVTALATCLLALAGCAGQGSGTAASSTTSTTGAQAPAEQRGPGANQAAGDPSKVAPLAAERRSELASGFPIEVPVPDGAVTRADAQGDSAWVYELSVGAQPFDVAAWYRAAYASANWQLVRDQVASSGGTLIFVKGEGAQSKIRLTAEPGGTKVTASVGVGEPVGETL
jgi:hypothetical protein